MVRLTLLGVRLAVDGLKSWLMGSRGSCGAEVWAKGMLLWLQ